MTLLNMWGHLCPFGMKLFSLLNLSFFVCILLLKNHDSIFLGNKSGNHPKINMLSVWRDSFNTHVNRHNYGRNACSGCVITNARKSLKCCSFTDSCQLRNLEPSPPSERFIHSKSRKCELILWIQSEGAVKPGPMIGGYTSLITIHQQRLKWVLWQ